MNITPKTIAYAIHGIFVSREVPVGGTLTMDALKKLWPETRLRTADLVRGLDALCKSGHLELHRNIFGFEIRLLNLSFGEVATDDDRKAFTAMTLARRLRGTKPAYAPGTTMPEYGRRPGDLVSPHTKAGR